MDMITFPCTMFLSHRKMAAGQAKPKINHCWSSSSSGVVGWGTGTRGELSAIDFGSVPGGVSRAEYQVLGSTSIPARLDTLVYLEPF